MPGLLDVIGLVGHPAVLKLADMGLEIYRINHNPEVRFLEKRLQLLERSRLPVQASPAATRASAPELPEEDAPAPSSSFRPGLIATAPEDPQVDSAYNPYALDAPELDFACIPCARKHLAASAGLLEEAVRFIHGGKPFENADVQDRLYKAEKEYLNLMRGDWIPAKIAKNPEDEQAVVERYYPQVRELHAELTNLAQQDDPANGIQAISAKADELGAGFQREVLALLLRRKGEKGPIGRAVESAAMRVPGERTSRVTSSDKSAKPDTPPESEEVA